MKKVVITGVTRGLGRALAEELITRGHLVIGCGRGAEGIIDLRFAHAAPHDFSVVDVTEPVKVELWAERVLGMHGAPDLLINNAALMNDPAPLWEVPAEKFSRLIDVNIKGTANVIRAFAPAMVKAGRGVIVNYSSGWGRSVDAKVAPYCASKWAIEGLTRALAEELPEGMAAVSLNPGVIDTDMLRQCWAEGAEGHAKPAEWAKRAADVVFGFGPKDNGRPASV
ncbi:oxidoreductase [Termitidicoccus mucosus]|uniref:Oxidoreductase n=2 Tax=Termitidicoccus mucosus TaxID=1184151 RepID=A0A178IE83_9BACT|nr:oxidoreductase [Opitutaceae bacterium TSB47]